MNTPWSFCLRFAWRRLLGGRGHLGFVLMALLLGGGLVCLSLAAVLRLQGWQPDFPASEQIFRVRLAMALPELPLGLTLPPEIDDMQASAQLVALLMQKSSDTEMLARQDCTTVMIDGERQRLARVSRHFFTLFGVTAAAGRLPRPDSGEVLISPAFLQRRFGSFAAAEGQAVQVGEQTKVIVGLLPGSFLPPQPLDRQRLESGGDLMEVFDERRQAPPAERQILAGSRLFVRSPRSGSLRNWVLEVIRPHPERQFYGARLEVSVTPIASDMSAGDRRLAGWSLSAASVLALALLTSTLALSRVRLLARGEEQAVLALIAGQRQHAAFEKAEILGLTGLTALAGLLLQTLVFLLLRQLADPAPAWLDGGFLWRAQAGALLLSLLYGAVLWLWAGRTRRRGDASGGAGTAGGGDAVAVRGGAGGGLVSVLMRGLFAGQVLVGATLVLLALVLSGSVIEGTRALMAQVPDRLLVWRVAWQSAAAEGFAEEVDRLKADMARLPGVRASALMFADPLALEGVQSGFFGPNLPGASVTTHADGSVVFRSDGHLPVYGPEMVGYLISAVVCEPAAVDLLGLGLRSGQALSADHPQTVLLSEAAAHAIFHSAAVPTGTGIATGFQNKSGAPWQGALRVGGLFTAQRVAQTGSLAGTLLRRPTVLLPYQRAPVLDNGVPVPAHFLIALDQAEDATAVRAALPALLTGTALHGARSQVFDLREEAKQRLAAQWLQVVLAIAALLLIVLTITVGMAAQTRYACAVRQGEIGLRRALGCKDSTLRRWLLQRELMAPALALLLWGVTLTVLTAFGIGAQGFASVLLTLLLIGLALLLSSVTAVRRALRLSPYQALQGHSGA